ncbi:MAG: hypothetical protein P8016_09325 [Sedimentisphaerales bacterium]
MNLPNFKDILKVVLEKLSIFRNNVPLLVSVIIAMVAVLLFIPTQLLSSSLTKEIQEKSITKGAAVIDRFKDRTVSPNKLKAEQESLDKLASDANSIERLAIQTTQRNLLNDVIFNLDPNNPNFSQSIFFEFGRSYRDGIDKFIESHNAILPPTKEEIEDELESSRIESIIQSQALGMGRSYDTMASQENITGIIVDELCRKKAGSAFAYIDPYTISGYEFWTTYEYTSWNEDIQNCWYSQLGYWVITDVFDTIVAMNEGHKSLLEAPVKRLLKVGFSDETGLVRVGNMAGIEKKYAGRPQYVLSTVDIPKETPTGRYCDENNDVIHFNVTFIVSTSEFPQLVKELCSAKEHKYTDKSGQTHTYKHNQITVLDMTIKSVDMKKTDNEFCRYGEDPVSEVVLNCEYLFNRKGYDDIKPQSVKETLGEITLY